MVREAEQAESKADFVHKMSIALKGSKRDGLLARTAASPWPGQIRSLATA
ncbi:hypothetical protein [Povalibacter sp.]